MERLYSPENIKIHFAGVENENYINAVKQMGVNYALYSAFLFIFKKLFSKTQTLTAKDMQTSELLAANFKHVIQDSGLFSLLYGSKKHLADKNTVYKWYDALVEYTLEHSKDFAIVEIDCQDILGTEVAWDLRRRMRDDLPNHRIINVFHLSDGVYGLDRLIEFSDYIGVGSGIPSNSSYSMFEVSSYIKEKSPSTDIHLLGCTTLKTIKKCNFCTSADSITWKNPLRFGAIGDYHISDLDVAKIKHMFGEDTWHAISRNNSEASTNAICAAIEMHKRWYQINCGNQDFTKDFQK